MFPKEEATERTELIPILDRDAALCERGNGICETVDGIEMDVDKDLPTELEPHFTLLSTVLFAVGQTIGSGIFVSPNEVIKQVGSPGMALVIWLLSGFISLTGALSFAELGTMIKRSGGEYQYLKAAYGDLLAFVYVWMCGVIRNAMGCAVIALTFSSYLISIFLSHEYPHFLLMKKTGAAAAIVIIIAINAYSTKCGIRMANLFCVLKLGALFALTVLGVWKLGEGGVENIKVGFKDTDMNPGTWTTAFFAALWSYSGWNCINLMAGEIKNPSKNVPRALVISQIMLISVYLLANTAYCSILTLQELYEVDAIALFVGKKMLARYGDFWGRFGEVFFGVSVVVSTYGSLSSSLMASSRLGFIAAQEGMFPKCVGLIQSNTGTPIVGLLYMGFTAFMCVWPSNITHLIAYVGFLSWFWWGLCFLAVPVLRWRLPCCPRQFKVNLLIPAIAVLSTVYLVIGPFFVNPYPCLLWIAITLIGVPIYYGFVDEEKTCSRWMGKVNDVLAKILRAEL